nr:hypothetical protein X990_5232 [Burkholderia pseudomallei MSHR4868]
MNLARSGPYRLAVTPKMSIIYLMSNRRRHPSHPHAPRRPIQQPAPADSPKPAVPNSSSDPIARRGHRRRNRPPSRHSGNHPLNLVREARPFRLVHQRKKFVAVHVNQFFMIAGLEIHVGLPRKAIVEERLHPVSHAHGRQRAHVAILEQLAQLDFLREHEMAPGLRPQLR